MAGVYATRDVAPEFLTRRIFFLLGLAPGLASVGVEVTRGVAPMPLLDCLLSCELQELSWLLEAEQQETRRLQEELKKARDGFISVAEHQQLLAAQESRHTQAFAAVQESCERLSKQKEEADAALTQATKGYGEDLEKLERKSGEAEREMKELTDRLATLAVGIWGKDFMRPLCSLCLVDLWPCC